MSGFLKNIGHYVQGKKGKNLAVKILAVSTVALFFSVWITTKIFANNLDLQLVILKLAVILWFTFSGVAWLLMALRQEFIQLLTIKGSLAIILGLTFAIGSWFVALLLFIFL
ncbi:MAG: hypothetical protein R6W69_04485 [Anaerolineales bacterium]